MRRWSAPLFAFLLLAAVACEEAPTDAASPEIRSADVRSSAHGDAGAEGEKLFEFEALVGNSRPIVGAAFPIRGVNAGGLPWVLEKGEAKLAEDGRLEVEVEGLVLDPDDPAVQDAGLAGVNPVSDFRAILSCLSIEAGEVVTVNLTTETSEATTGPAEEGGGDAKIEEMLDLPDPCIAPIVFVTSPGGSWFAASGFTGV